MTPSFRPPVRIFEAAKSLLWSLALLQTLLLQTFPNPKLSREHLGGPCVAATYYAFLWLVCLLNVLRCSVQMWQVHPLSHVHLWNGLWLSTRFGMTFLEVSVVVFLAQGYHVSGHQALVRTVAVSGVLAGVDLMIKALLIYVGGVQLFVEQETEQPASYYWDKWGYWAAHEFIFALVYGAILVLPYTDWRDKLPARPSFYRYAACLLVLNALNALAALLVAAGDMDGGYCLGGVCNFVYYAAYPPLLYHTFLADFFRDDDTLELESAYYSEMRDAGYFDAGDGDDFDY